MLSFLYSIVGFILAIAVLVTVHEFGHYWVARRLGVKVLRFSVGFGKPLWRKVAGKDQTEYVVAAIPLGGYVKMLGEGDAEYSQAEASRAFDNQRLWKRAAIVLAGPMINFLFAVLVYAGLNNYGFQTAKPFLGNLQKESVLYQAGLREGDELLSVDGKKFHYFNEHQLHVFNRALNRDQMLLNISRQGQKKQINVDFSELTVKSYKPTFLAWEIGLQGVQPKALPIIGRIVKDFPAADSDLQVGDKVIRINEQLTSSWKDIVDIISTAEGGLMDIQIERAGVFKLVSIRPRVVSRDGQKIRQVGIAPEILPVDENMLFNYKYSLAGSFVRGLDQTWQMSVLTLRILVKMLIGQASHKNISGPITIASIAGDALQLSWIYYFSILAAISISLGVINLLPVPMLDGGHLLYYFIEAIKGSPVPEKAMLVGQKIGLLLLAGLMSLAFYNDIFRLLN